MSDANNLKNRIPYSVLLAIIVIIGGSLVTWGETRLTVANNSTQIDDHKDADSEAFRKLQEDQKKLDEKLNGLSQTQGRLEERLQNIRDSQRRQETDTQRILNLLQNGNPR